MFATLTPLELCRRKGSAYYISLILLTILSTLAITLSNASVLNIREADNHATATDARLAAESGLEYARLNLLDCKSEQVLTNLPDMLTVVKSHLETKIPNATVSLTGSGADRKVTVSSISLSPDQSFDLEVKISAFDAEQPTVPSELELVVNGQSGSTSRRVGMDFQVDIDRSLLHYAVATTVRTIIRGNDTQINGDVLCAWERPVGWWSTAWPMDIGNSDYTYRSQESIRIHAYAEDGTLMMDQGMLATTMSEAEFTGDEYINGTLKDSRGGIRHDDLESQLEYNADDVVSRTWEDFNTSSYKNRPEAPDGEVPLDTEKQTLEYPRDNAQTLETDWTKYYHEDGYWKRGYMDENCNWVVADYDPDGNLCERFYWDNGYIRHGSAGRWVTAPAPDDTQPKVVCEYWANDWSFWRAFYSGYNGSTAEKPAFKNLHIPQGSHAHFKNCHFTGITYIECDEETDLDNSNINDHYDKYNSLRNGLDGAGGSATNTLSCNNVVFEDCTFDGPIVTGVPKDFRYQDNSLMFIGNTTFNSTAIKEELEGTTILAPNFNVNIGDFSQSELGSDSKLVGLIVGGIVDIRDNAIVEGTVLSMANLDHVPDSSVSGWGSNIGNWERNGEDAGDGGGFTPSTLIKITPDPDNVMPLGVKKRYTVYPVLGSYREYND